MHRDLNVAAKGAIIISLHLPKTAGSSFMATLENQFGNRLLKDYADLPLNTSQYDRNKAALQASLRIARNDFHNVACIHGHFLPIKYLLLATKREIRFVTWMRDPVERVLSHYFYWRRTPYGPKTSPALHRKMIEENWSLERFCLGPELRNIYGQFLWGFPIEYFDFIGITESYKDDLVCFARHFLKHASLEPEMVNVNQERKGNYQIDQTLRREIESYHANDIDLYNRIRRV